MCINITIVIWIRVCVHACMCLCITSSAIIHYSLETGLTLTRAKVTQRCSVDLLKRHAILLSHPKGQQPRHKHHKNQHNDNRSQSYCRAGGDTLLETLVSQLASSYSCVHTSESGDRNEFLPPPTSSRNRGL